MARCNRCDSLVDNSAPFCPICGEPNTQTSSNDIAQLNRESIDEFTVSNSDIFTVNDWENGRYDSFFSGFLILIKSILFNTREGFKNYSSTPKMAEAIKFFAIIYFIISPSIIISEILSNKIFNIETTKVELVLYVFLPIISIVSNLSSAMIGGIINHGLLKLFKSANAPISATINSTIYSSTASILLLIPIPIIPALISAIWSFIINIVSISEIHKISNGRSALILLIPLIVIFTLVFAVIFLLIISLPTGLESLGSSLNLKEIIDLLR